MAATAVFGYAWLVPAFLYATLWWIGGSKQENQTIDSSTSFLELLCVYGYSLAIYIPVSVLWTIQYPIFQWTLALGGAGLSGAVLLLAIWPSVQNHPKKMGIILIGVVLLLHLLLACGFMMYFFHGPSTSVVSSGTEDVASTKLPKPNNINATKDVVKDAKIAPTDNKRSIEVNDSGGAKSVVSSGPEDVASNKSAKPNNNNTPKDVAKDSKIAPTDNKRSIEVIDSGGAKEPHKTLAKQTSENDKTD